MLTKQQQKVLELAKRGGTDLELLWLDSLQEIIDLLKEISAKETPEPLQFPTIPEPKETDLSEVVKKLEELIKKDINIEVNLKIL